MYLPRLNLFEIEDQSWCPAFLRNALTDFLQFALVLTKAYAPILPKLAEALRATDSRQIVDLCSGGAGPWPWLKPELERELGDAGPVAICLTDKYPNLAAFQRTQNQSPEIGFHPFPVDATRVPEALNGFRTLFTSFHHFPPELAREILADAVRSGEGIAICEMTHRRPRAVLLTLLSPLFVLLLTPLIRPVQWSRFLWTYLVPLVPFIALFDGVVSCFRTYTPDELRQMAKGLSEDYQWEAGELRDPKNPTPVTYLIGIPSRSAVNDISGQPFSSRHHASPNPKGIGSNRETLQH